MKRDLKISERMEACPEPTAPFASALCSISCLLHLLEEQIPMPRLDGLVAETGDHRELLLEPAQVIHQILQRQLP